MDINLLLSPSLCVPDLDSSDNSLTTEDSENSSDPTPQSRHILSNPTAQYSDLSSDSYLIQSLPQSKLCNGRIWQDSHETYSPIDQVVSNVTDDSPNWENLHYGMFTDTSIGGLSLKGAKPGQSPYTAAYEKFSSKRGIPDFSSMAEPELSYSTTTTESSAANSGYRGSEQTRSEPLKRQEDHRWSWQLRDQSYIRQGKLHLHERKKHQIPSETARNVRQEAGAQDDRIAKLLQSILGKVSPSLHSKDLAHPSSKDEVNLMDYQGHDTTDGLDDTRVSKKRENPDDDASHCSGAFSSEEGDDSDGECDNIATWNCSQSDALPSFLPYIRGHDADTSSPCGDSPDNGSTTSGSTTSGTTSDTPASSASGRTGGNSLQGNEYTSPSTGIGASNNSNNPILGINGTGPNFTSDPQPLPLICWYSAAGIACTSKHVKMSIEVRHLWNDHAWGKNRKLPNHRLSDACQRCKRLFLTQQLLVEHVAPQGPCRVLSSVELEEFNKEPNRLGISLECKEAIDDLRRSIDKVTKGDKMPAFHDNETMALLKQRVDSNVLLYINESNTSEKTARSQLWKWYLIFKKLRPDDEVPRNPFISAQRLAGPEERPRADARRVFLHIFDQKRMEGSLPELDDDQRTALGRVFLDTLEMLGANEANERHRSVQTKRRPRKRQRISPPESYERAPDSTDLTPAPTTPALAPAPIPVEVPPSVRNPVNFQHPTFTPPEVQNQLLPQIPSSVPQSFMPSADNLWLLRQQQQQPQQQQLQLQQEAEDAHSLFPTGDFDYINLSTDYGGLPGFGARDC